jgi:hypothetical protein
MIGDSPHTKASPIIKHKAKVIMNLNNYTYIRHKRRGRRALMPYSLKSWRNVTHNKDPSSHS